MDRAAPRQRVGAREHAHERLAGQFLLLDARVEQRRADERDVDQAMAQLLGMQARVADRQLEGDVGIAGAERLDDLARQPAGQRAGEAQAQPAAGAGAGFASALRGPRGPRQDVTRVVEQHHARGRQGDAAAIALEEPDAQLVLERAHLLRDARLREVQLLGRAAEVQLFGHRHEGSELPELHKPDDRRCLSQPHEFVLIRTSSVPYRRAAVEERPLSCAFRPFELADPFAFYSRARTEEPVFFSEELGYYVVTRHADIHAIFKQPKVVLEREHAGAVQAAPSRGRAGPGRGQLPGLQRAVGPPAARAHAPARLIAKAFTPRRVAALEPEIRELTTAMIERFAGRGEADLVETLTHELPALVIFRLLGIPDEDVPHVKEWAASRVSLNFGDLPVSDQVQHAENLVRYWRYCIELIEARQREPRDDLPSALVRLDDASISKDEMAGLVYGQLTAGHETTSALLASGIKELLAQRERWVELTHDAELIPTAVEELLRLVTPVFAWKRKAKAAARVGDGRHPRGRQRAAAARLGQPRRERVRRT